MGARGPAPTPTKVLEARGSWRAKERAGEVQFPPGRPVCPTWLTGEAQREWQRQVEQLEAAGILCEVDRALLAAYCEAWGEFAALVYAISERVRENPEVGYGGPGMATLVSMKNKASERLLRLAGQFGFSPAARVRVKGAERTEDKEDGKGRFFRIG